MKERRKLLLLILDGWGINEKEEGNTIKIANLPFYNAILKKYPHTQISASGNDVGLPAGLMGNSEVGHLNIGAGRVVWQEITRIDIAIKNGTFFKNSVLLDAFSFAKKNNSSVHLLGLVSDGGVHSLHNHYYALLKMAKLQGFSRDRVIFHCFTDGRDTPPKSGIEHIKNLTKQMDEMDVGRIATIQGRYYAMDRDKRWDRIQLAYKAMRFGDGVKEISPIEAIANSYARGETDEFIKPIVICNMDGKYEGGIKENDTMIFFNFRADRARELTRVFTEKNFDEFKIENPPDVHFVTMTKYDEKFNLPCVFEPQRMNNILPEIISKNGLKQLRIAETEKYAHVTYFFNGGEEKCFDSEDRILIPSPKVATYDLKPEMSAFEVTSTVLSKIQEDKYNFIVLNYANPDMVGHTGIISASVKAVESLDKCMQQVITNFLNTGGVVLLTSDHGNCEQMIDYATGEPHTAHTTNPVPFILISEKYKNMKFRTDGKLCDIAPTILQLLNIPQPQEMDGKTLLLEFY